MIRTETQELELQARMRAFLAGELPDRETLEDGTIVARNQESAPTDSPTERGYWHKSTTPGVYIWKAHKTDAEIKAMLAKQAQVRADARCDNARRDWQDAYENGEGDY